MKVTTGQVNVDLPQSGRTATAHAGQGGEFTRRGVALALFGAAAGAVFGPQIARAESPLQALQSYQLRAEWADRYDTAIAELSQVAGTQPTLSPMTAAQIEQAIPVYQQIIARGGWPTMPEKTRLKLGSRDRAVATLRQRLAVSGDLVETAGRTDTFDSYVDAAVRRFQVRHGLQPDGVVGGGTVAALNVPAEQRLRQLELNLVRVRSMSGFLGERYVLVNIPSAEIEAVQGDVVRSRHTGVVGKIDRQSPILSAKIQEINFNPYWHVPVSIIRKDLIPKMQADPQYLVKNRIRIYDGKGNELQATDIDWNTDQATQYLFRQEPGLENSMGSVKINFPNAHAVYMHDTPQKSLFGQNGRFHSSGCVRVQNVRELVAWLLETNPDWPKSRIDEAIRTGERIDAKLQAPVPVYFNYVTAWATQNGVVHFREDVYQRDMGDAVAMNSAVGSGTEEAFYQLPQ